MESVVKIDVVSSAPDFNIPWQHHDTGESSGSGCVITGPNGNSYFSLSSLLFLFL
jgi:hypothetical protein